MAEIIGTNTPSAEALRGIVDEVERVNTQIKELQDARSAIYAAAKSKGFNPTRIREIVRLRTKKPHDIQEAETELDVYKHIFGLAQEPPLFRQIAALAREAVGGEKLLEAFKLLVPPSGELICTIAGKRMRLWRDKDGEPRSENYAPPEPAASAPNRSASRVPKPDVPNCTTDEAEALGKQAAKDNVPVIDNPFPYGDERRPRWDAGWRAGAGNDGMGGS